MKPNQEKEKEMIAALEAALKEIPAQKETNAALVKEIETLKSQKPQAPSRPSKSREQAAAVAELLKQGR